MAKGIKGSTPTENKPVRTSFNLKPDIQKKLKHIAFVDETDMSTLVDEALTELIRKWEKKNGPIEIKKK